MVKLSVCIPTFNREKHLVNCLNSIDIALSNLTPNGKSDSIEICVSDNCSVDNTELVVRKYQDLFKIKYSKNPSNIGISKNFLNVISMAEGEYVWLIGDDDLILPNGFSDLMNLLNKNPTVDFFYVNSYQLDSSFLSKYPSPFDTSNLPLNMNRFSKYTKDGPLKFIDLISPRISFDFLGGMFLSVFRRSSWEACSKILDVAAVEDSRTFSHFDNTFPHLKIWAHAFSKSNAYFNSLPMNVCLSGAREWSPMSPLIMSVRIIEALELYRKVGLKLPQFFYCKNYALRSFVPDIFRMLANKSNSGYFYINLPSIFFKNLLYPNTYLSLVYYVIKKIIQLIKERGIK